MLAKPLNLQDQQQQNLAMHLLKLVLNCLNYDFIGSSADESADDLCTVQIPTSWRSSKIIIITARIFNILYGLFVMIPKGKGFPSDWKKDVGVEKSFLYFSH